MAEEISLPLSISEIELENERRNVELLRSTAEANDSPIKCEHFSIVDDKYRVVSVYKKLINLATSASFTFLVSLIFSIQVLPYHFNFIYAVKERYHNCNIIDIFSAVRVCSPLPHFSNNTQN